MNSFNAFFHPFQAENMLRAGVLIFIGYLISRLLSATLLRSLQKKLRPHQIMLLRRVIFLVVFLLFFASAMQQLNFRISALLGATGILTVALGIASQTSMTNLISGLFLIGEKPFEIGDSLTLNGTSGEIISIDAMSVRIRTSENTMVRIPNEILIKSSFTNLSFFPNRRIQINIGVSYNENINHIMMILLKIVQRHPLCLSDPQPAVIVESFGDTAINLQLQVWTRTEDRKDVQSILYQSIKEAFDQEGITMPFPTRTVYVKNLTENTPNTPSPIEQKLS